MHYDSEKNPSMATARWLNVLGAGLGGLVLWGSLSPWARAQRIPVIPPAPDINIDQIVLPPADDVPEEILRTEIIFEARSPIDGMALSPADYAQLQTALSTAPGALTLNDDIRFILFLLQARRAFKPVIPFLP